MTKFLHELNYFLFIYFFFRIPKTKNQPKLLQNSKTYLLHRLIWIFIRFGNTLCGTNQIIAIFGRFLLEFIHILKINQLFNQFILEHTHNLCDFY